jgi:hypothetical protein
VPFQEGSDGGSNDNPPSCTWDTSFRLLTPKNAAPLFESDEQIEEPCSNALYSVVRHILSEGDTCGSITMVTPQSDEGF